VDAGADDPWSHGGKPIPPDIPGGPPATAGARPVAFLIVQAMLLTGFDAPIEQALYVDRPLRQAELLQAIARTNRPERNKPYGLVVDYVALTDNLAKALAEYDLEDLDGMREGLLSHELPILRASAETLRSVLESLGGIPETDEAWEGLLAALADPQARARFDRAADDYLASVARLLPRAEALTFNELTVRVGQIQWRTRRRFRDSGTGAQDPYRYGALLRDLLDQHLRAEAAVQQVPPVEITDPGFRAAVDALRSDQARVREYTYALRHHFDNWQSTDPARFHLLSEKLENLLRGMDGAWESLADELGSLVSETLATDAEVEAYALDPLTEGPIFNILLQGLSHVPQSASRDWIADISRELTGYIRIQVGPPHFPTSDHLQQNLRRELRKRIAHTAGISRQESGPLAEQIMDTVMASRDHFLP
jgi:type I restriction enzyme, R subunit